MVDVCCVFCTRSVGLVINIEVVACVDVINRVLALLPCVPGISKSFSCWEDSFLPLEMKTLYKQITL